jgi:hypothetical protein
MPSSKNLSNVNIGTSPNSGDGDVLRDAFIKINDNFNALYTGGQYNAAGDDSKLYPGYSWSDDKDTGMYHLGPGKIGFSLNNRDSLLLDENGSIKWFNKELSTQDYVIAQLNNFTGGISAANIVVTTGAGNTTVTVNGIPVVSALPTAGNYQGRIVFYLGDIWTYSSYPIGNGAGLSANPSIARIAGSDSRWVRFRGDQAVTIGLVRPAIAAEGTTFYETANATIYLYLSGQWRTLTSLITSNAPAGLDVLVSLPATGDPNNYTGRTVVVGSNSYIFISGTWNNLSNYITGDSGSGSGILSSSTLPLSANVGELYRKTGTDAGLYIYDNGWKTIPQYAGNTGTARINTVSSLPTDVTYYNGGDLIITGNVTYILKPDKSQWQIFSPGANTTATSIVLNAGQVGTRELANASITLTKLIANTIVGTTLVSNTITSRELAANSVTFSKIADDSITSLKIQQGSITDREVAFNSINGNKIQEGSITSRELSPISIDASAINAEALSDISQNAGIITSGVLRSTDGKMIIDLNSKFLRIEL